MYIFQGKYSTAKGINHNKSILLYMFASTVIFLYIVNYMVYMAMHIDF